MHRMRSLTDRSGSTVQVPSDRLLDGPTVRRLLGWYASSRLVVALAVVSGWTVRPELPLVALLRRFDAAWYLGVAEFGYVAQAATVDAVTADPGVLRGAFFPLWPVLVRLTTPPGIPVEVSATVLALVLGFGVVVGSWLVVARLANRPMADRAALLTCVFPGSFVLSMAYAEALMLCLAVGCLYALIRRWWTVAGMAAALATAARPNAIALIPACCWAAAVAVHRRGEWRSLVAPALAPVGVVAFHVFLWLRTGRSDAWFLIQRNGWDERTDFGARNVERIGRLLAWADPHPATVLVGLGFLVVILAAWALWSWQPPLVLSLYAASVIGLAVIAQTLGPRPRFVFTALPLVWALAVRVPAHVFGPLVIASTGGLAALSVVYIVGDVAMP